MHDRRIQEILPQRMAEWKKTASVADHKAEEFLTQLAKRKEVSAINTDVTFSVATTVVEATCKGNMPV